MDLHREFITVSVVSTSLLKVIAQRCFLVLQPARLP